MLLPPIRAFQGRRARHTGLLQTPDLGPVRSSVIKRSLRGEHPGATFFCISSKKKKLVGHLPVN
jgi:hypothetical protein